MHLPMKILAILQLCYMSEAGGSKHLCPSTHAYKYVQTTKRLGTAPNALVCFANSLDEKFRANFTAKTTDTKTNHGQS